jgi:hypothetical protein
MDRSYFPRPAADGATFKTATGAPALSDYIFAPRVRQLAVTLEFRPSLRAELKSKLDAADEGGDDA